MTTPVVRSMTQRLLDAVLGAVFGDIAGRRFEGAYCYGDSLETAFAVPWLGQKPRYPIDNWPISEIPLWTPDAAVTDDTMMTLALCDCWLTHGSIDAEYLAEMFKRYVHENPLAGYATMFYDWAVHGITSEVRSWGNGAAMRTAAIPILFPENGAWYVAAEEQARISHGDEGVRSAQAVSAAIIMAAREASTERLSDVIRFLADYDMTRRITSYRLETDERRREGNFARASLTVPIGIRAYLEATSLEHAVRLAISAGGDTDTQACIAGSIAASRWGIPELIRVRTLGLLRKAVTRSRNLRNIYLEFEERILGT